MSQRPATPSCDAIHITRFVDAALFAYWQCFVHRNERFDYPLALSTLRLSFTLCTSCSLVIFELGSRFLYRPISIASRDLPVPAGSVTVAHARCRCLSSFSSDHREFTAKNDRKVTYLLQPPPQLRISPCVGFALWISFLWKHIAVPHVP